MGHTLAYTAVGEYAKRGEKELPAKPEDLEFAGRFWKLTEGLLAEGKFKVHQPDVRPGGLDGVMKGLDDLRQGRVSGKKLVYRVAGTEGVSGK